MKYKAFIFDLNGTIIDDMKFHTRVWYEILNDELEANLTYDAVQAEMYGKNSELLERVFGTEKFTPQQMHQISVQKEQRYQHIYRPHLKLMDGLDIFLQDAQNNKIKMGIGTAAIMFNVDYILDGLHIRKYFDAVVSADDVAASKPHPETFLSCAKKLGISPSQCLVFEDTPKGVETAVNAGMDSVVILSGHRESDFTAADNIIAFVNDYKDERLISFL